MVGYILPLYFSIVWLFLPCPFLNVQTYHVGTGIRVKTYYKIYHLAPFSYFLMGKRFADFMNKIEKKCAKP